MTFCNVVYKLVWKGIIHLGIVGMLCPILDKTKIAPVIKGVRLINLFCGLIDFSPLLNIICCVFEIDINRLLKSDCVSRLYSIPCCGK